MDHLTPPQVAEWLADPTRTPPVLLDIREPWEHATARIAGATLVPMSTLTSRVAEIEALQEAMPDATDEVDANDHPSRTIICICHHGARSMQVAAFLERQGFENVANMTGGIHRWSQQVDPAVPTY